MENVIFGFVMFGGPLLVIVLFDVLAKRRQQENAECAEHALGITRQSAGAPKRERGKADEPNNEHGSGAGSLYVDSDVLEHTGIPPNAPYRAKPAL